MDSSDSTPLLILKTVSQAFSNPGHRQRQRRKGQTILGQGCAMPKIANRIVFDKDDNKVAVFVLVGKVRPMAFLYPPLSFCYLGFRLSQS